MKVVDTDQTYSADVRTTACCEIPRLAALRATSQEKGLLTTTPEFTDIPVAALTRGDTETSSTHQRNLSYFRQQGQSRDISYSTIVVGHHDA